MSPNVVYVLLLCGAMVASSTAKALNEDVASTDGNADLNEDVASTDGNADLNEDVASTDGNADLNEDVGSTDVNADLNEDVASTDGNADLNEDVASTDGNADLNEDVASTDGNAIQDIREKYETDIRELENALDNTNRANAEYLKQIKSLQIRVKEMEVLLEDERLLADDLAKQLQVYERRRVALTLAVTSLTNDTRRLEGNKAAMQSDLDDAINNIGIAEKHAKRLGAENNRLAAENSRLADDNNRLADDNNRLANENNRLVDENNRLADELRQEQENYKNADSLRKQLEIEIREITIRLEEAEAFAVKEGKRIIAKLQGRVRDLEAEVESEARRVRESVANMRKAERINKEILAQTEEERRQLAEVISLNDQLNLRIKTYKRQMEEAEDVANLTMNKYRKAQTLVEEAEGRADSAEKNLQTVRRARSMSVTREMTVNRVIRM